MANKKLGITAELPPFRQVNMKRLEYIVDCSQDIYAVSSENKSGVMFLFDEESMVIVTKENGYIGLSTDIMRKILKEALECAEVMN